MNQNNLELYRGADNTLRLAYWDSLRGDDVLLEITPDGKTYKLEPGTPPGQERQRVKLEVELYLLADKICGAKK